MAPGVGGRGLSSPLVGRERELQRLAGAFERTVDRHSGELLTIVGPAGIGKSRLAIDFAESVREQAAVAVGRCLSYGEGLTFWPLREVVTAIAGSADGAGPEEVRSGIARVLAGDDDAAVIVERVAGAVGWSESAATPLETFWAFGSCWRRPRPSGRWWSSSRTSTGRSPPSST